MEFLGELVALALSVLGTIIIARASAADTLPKWIDNDAILGALLGLFTVGICFGLTGIAFKMDNIGLSALVDTAIMVAASAVVGWLLFAFAGPKRVRGV